MRASGKTAWRRAAGGLMLAGLLAACAPKDAFAPLEALNPGESGRVVRVIDGDALVLDTGQSVRLVGIEAPAGPSRKREAEPGHELAKRLLEDMVLGRTVQLYYGGLTRDRYDRALAQVRTTDKLGPELWLNAEMVRRGGARVRVYPDTAAANDALVPLETEARAESRGLWGDATWQIISAARLPADARQFTLIEGTVTDMQGTDEYGAVCELSLEGAALRLAIETAAAELCQTPRGTRLEARGYVRDGIMEITHPLNTHRAPS